MFSQILTLKYPYFKVKLNYLENLKMEQLQTFTNGSTNNPIPSTSSRLRSRTNSMISYFFTRTSRKDRFDSADYFMAKHKEERSAQELSELVAALAEDP